MFRKTVKDKIALSDEVQNQVRWCYKIHTVGGISFKASGNSGSVIRHIPFRGKRLDEFGLTHSFLICRMRKKVNFYLSIRYILPYEYIITTTLHGAD